MKSVMTVSVSMFMPTYLSDMLTFWICTCISIVLMSEAINDVNLSSVDAVAECCGNPVGAKAVAGVAARRDR